MGASVQPDPVADYLAAKQQASGDPVSDYLAARAGAVTPHGASGTFDTAPPQQTALQAFIDHFAQGLTFGTARNMVAGAESLLGRGSYADNLAAINRDLQAQQSQPNTSGVATASELGGAMLSPVNKLLEMLPFLSAGKNASGIQKAASAVKRGAATGAAYFAGSANGGPVDRAKAAAEGTAVGGLTGGLFHGLGVTAGATGEAIANRINPTPKIAKVASGLLDATVPGRLADASRAASVLDPEGSVPAPSLFTSTVPEAGLKQSRFLPFLRAVGASPEAGQQVEGQLMYQRGTFNDARSALGDKMDDLKGDVQITPKLRKVLSSVKTALGAKTPDVPPEELEDINPLGLEKSTPFAFDEEKKTLSIQELRDALSRLRFLSRGAVKRGLEANGIDTRNIGIARDALQKHLYGIQPDFASLDKDYAVASNQLRQVELGLKTVQRSRSNYGANEGYGATSGSLGGSLPSGRHGVVMTALDKIFTNRAGAADAVARLITQPGGPELINQLRAAVPAPNPRLQRIPGLLTRAAIPGMHGLLTSVAGP